MAFVVFQDGVTTVTLRYLETKPNGSFQYRRRIPIDLQSRYSGRKTYVQSLKRDRVSLAQEASRITARLDEEWKSVRGLASSGTPSDHVASAERFYIPAHAFEIERKPIPQPTILISQALELYLAHHRKGRLAKFRSDNERVIAFVTSAVGDLPIQAYTRQHAEQVRDRWIRSSTTGSVRRRLNSVYCDLQQSSEGEAACHREPLRGARHPQRA